LSATSCKNKSETTTGEEKVMTGDSAGMMSPTTATPTASASGEPHYKCTKAGCTGSGAAQGKCPICGSDLAHNPAYHNSAPGNSQQNPVTLNPTTPTTGATQQPTNITTAPAQTPPAAQNAKGEWHYACAKAGCGGGAGAAGNCPKCGGELAHNAAYHNN
jgi:hypothetical protein